MKTVSVMVAGLLVLLLAEAAAQAADIVVMSSTGLQAAFEALAPKLEKATGDKLVMTIGPANDLKDKIEGGATFDVTILTPALIDMLIHDGKVVPGSATNIARAGVGVAASSKNPQAAMVFLKYLTAPAAVPVLKTKGLELD